MGILKDFREYRKVKRGINIVDESGNNIDFGTWKKTFHSTKTTPILENVYSTIASEFSKIDLKCYKETKDIEGMTTKIISEGIRLIDNINRLLTVRPIEYLSPHDYKYLCAYQLQKFGHSLTYIERNYDSNGNLDGVKRLIPMNIEDYEFGYGFKMDNGTVLLQVRKKSENKVILLDYNNIIHVRLNPNDIFKGDKTSILDNASTLIKLFDTNLNTLLNEMLDSGEIKGIVEIGSASLGGLNQALKDDKQKISKQQEIVNRIKQTKGGILVLDAGEKWTSLTTTFNTMSKEQLETITKLMYSMKGINEKVINGTANEAEMEVFFTKTIVPIIEKFIEEFNYKILTQTARTQGLVIDYYRNPFEYVSITKASDSAYKFGDTLTQNERRKFIFKLSPLEGGDKLYVNKNFGLESVSDNQSTNDE